MLALSFLALAAPAAHAETRTLKLYFIHTGEKAEITFKRNGSYDKAGLAKLNTFLRDWRRNEPTKMDPRLFDLVWETYRAVGARDYIHVVSAYRSPATNSMLRSRSKAVAQKSQHMLGKAMDFYIPGVSLKKLRETGLKMQIGGVGYYPRSGSPFVHLDVGNVRHWPRMSRKELVAVFPNGRTLHVPSDGKPLPGYEMALASYQARKKSGTTALALASAGSTKPKSSGLFASLFGGGGADEEEEGGGTDDSVVTTKPLKTVKEAAPDIEQAPAKAVASVSAKATGKIAIVPPELAQPAQVETPVEETPESIIAALPARSIPVPLFAPRPSQDVGPAVPVDVPFGVAEALPDEATVADTVADEVAENIPLPSWRPDYKAAIVAQDEGPAQADMLRAMSEADVDVPVPSPAPDEAMRAAMVGVPMPDQMPSEGEFTVASVDDHGPALKAQIKDNNERLAMLATGATSKEAVAMVASVPKDATAIGAGAKTTKKSARAKVKDTKPSPKPLIVEAQPEATRWALANSGFVAPSEGVAPSVAHLIVRTAPSEVYSTGFQHGAEVADAGRFTGKAVKFMPVARFATN